MPMVFYYIRFEKGNQIKLLSFDFDFYNMYNVLSYCINILPQISITCNFFINNIDILEIFAQS